MLTAKADGVSVIVDEYHNNADGKQTVRNSVYLPQFEPAYQIYQNNRYI